MPPLLFDLDGTLVDTIDLIVASFRHVLEDLAGRPFTRREVIDLFGPTEPVIIDRFAPAGKRRAAYERFFEHYARNHGRLVTVFPGIPELLREAAGRGHPVAVITNKGRRTTEITLERSGLAPFVGTIVTGDDVARPKPDPEGIRLALARLGAEPARAWFVGDAPVDVLAGRAAGTRTCGVAWGGVHPPEETAALAPDRFCHTVDELRRLLWAPTAGVRREPGGAGRPG